MKIRIQKLISQAGIASRREAERFIREGRVTVNGKRVVEMGTTVDPETDKVKVDNKLVMVSFKKVYILLNKPKQYITSVRDPLGRPVVMDLIPEAKNRAVPVGRLDYDAEGLLLMTNDGYLSQKLQHPKYRLARTYLVKVKGVPTFEELLPVTKGIKLEDGPTLPARLEEFRPGKTNSWVEITVREGRNHLVKRLFERIGYQVLKIKRIAFDGLKLGDLPTGKSRHLTPAEISRLIRAVATPHDRLAR